MINQQKYIIFLITAWINNYIHYKMLDEITYTFETSTTQPGENG